VAGLHHLTKEDCAHDSPTAIFCGRSPVLPKPGSPRTSSSGPPGGCPGYYPAGPNGGGPGSDGAHLSPTNIFCDRSPVLSKNGSPGPTFAWHPAGGPGSCSTCQKVGPKLSSPFLEAPVVAGAPAPPPLGTDQGPRRAAEAAGSPDKKYEDEEGCLMCWTFNLLEARPTLPPLPPPRPSPAPKSARDRRRGPPE